jgi:hypothetical protein
MPTPEPAAPAADAAGPVRRPWWPAALGLGWVGLLLAPLLSPGRALANRDVLLFHLPLRVCLRNLVLAGVPPVWNPWLNGGQPLLSNPSYAAFYPPTWLALPLPPAYALSLLALLHAAIAFAGAWRLARRLGAGRGAAALAAIGYTGSGALLSLLSAFTLFCGMAWLPWVLAFGDDAFRRPAGRWLAPAALAALALAMQLLNGEPSMVTVGGLCLLASAAAAMRRNRAAAWRLPVPLLLAAALAAAQLLPAAARLAGTARAQGLPRAEATQWSSRPARLVEIVLPHFFGDPTRQGDGLLFGHGVHDLDYPYVASIYPGLLVSVVAISALCLWPIPRRGVWIACSAAGAGLALGRHNPLYEPLCRLLPPLAAQRYPERFVVLAIAPLAFAAALGWQHLLAERRAGRARTADLPLALSLTLLAAAATLTGVLYLAPAIGEAFLRGHAPLAEGGAGIARGLAFLRREGWAAVATAAATAALLALCRWRRPRPVALHALAVALLAADLWHYGRGLVQTVPVAEYREPPPLLRALAPPGSRLFVETVPEERWLPLARGDASLALAHALLERLVPYSASLWQVPYAFNEDYDRMLTHWGAVSLQVLHADLDRQPELAFRLLGAWGVDGMLLREATAAGRPPPAAAPPAAGTGGGTGAIPVAVPRVAAHDRFRLPLYRFVPHVTFHSSYGSALYVARGQGYAVDRQEHCVRANAPPATVSYPTAPRLLAFRDAPGRIELRYRARAGGFFVAAATFDDGWRAEVDGARRDVYPTAAGQLGVELPPGEHRLALAYRERLLPWGAAVSLLALAGCIAALAAARRQASRAPTFAVPAATAAADP